MVSSLARRRLAVWGTAQENARRALEHLDRRHVEGLPHGDHAGDQDVDPLRELLERGVLAEHTERALGRQERRQEGRHHEGDVDDLPVVRDQRDVLALGHQQVDQRGEQVFLLPGP